MKRRTPLLLSFVLAMIFLVAVKAQQVDTSLFRGINARSIGPAGMSGRISAIDAVNKNPNIIYVGSATGGIWKSINGGTDWKPVFDKEPVSSIGAIAIYQANPDIIWAGTGESNIRNSAGVGRGVYKSLDGGKTWEFMGLDKTETISSIQLDPTNPDVAYVGALGTNWGYTKDRGVYKTTDGGKTWEKILYVDEKTGVGDMIMDPSNPNKLIVSMWEHRRWPWFFKSGGPGSGLYLTVDGGNHWKKLTDKDGLPDGELGKIGLGISTYKPNIVYAMVEAKKSELLRSEDGGYTWKTVNSKQNVNPRPFYFGRIMVNPVNENIVYRIQFILEESIDAGKSFHNIQGNIHVDNHALWIKPNGETLIAGNDGGIAISHDRGKTWRFAANLPLAQYYHISVDNEIPYNVYGGLQDNGSWRGPSTSYKSDGIYNSDWKSLTDGDGFDIQADPDNPDAGYSMSQEGYFYYYNLKEGLYKLIRPTESDVKDRYNWNTAFAIDPFNSSTIYYGSQFIHKSTDKGKTWTKISPDLTTNDTTKQKQGESGGLTIDATGAENFTTILTISPSPVKQGVIWAGTDDGNLQLTKDRGKTWTLVSTELVDSKMVPAGTWIPRVKASKFDAATAFVVFENHRRHDWTPYIFVTHNYGESWQSLVTNNIDGYALTIEEDPVDKNLLFLGTEFNLYFSIDAGKHWTKWTHGLPTAPMEAMTIQKRESDLVIGTYGRAVYIIDDITPLRELNEQILKSKSHLFHVNDATEFIRATIDGTWFTSSDQFKGQNRMYGAYFTYYLSVPDSITSLEGTEKEKKATIQIFNVDSTLIRTFKGTFHNGINRVAWDLREKAPDRPRAVNKEENDRPGQMVLPGKYTVKIKAGDQEMSASFNVKSDPRFNTEYDKLKAHYDFNNKIGQISETAAKAFKQIKKTYKAIETVKEFAANLDTTKAKELKKKADELEKKLTKLANRITPDSTLVGIPDETGILTSELGMAGYLNFYPLDAPYQNALVKYDKVKKLEESILSDMNKLYSTDVAEFEKTIKNAGFTIFKKYKPIELK